MAFIRQGRWNIVESRTPEGLLHWELASSDMQISIVWPKEGSKMMDVRIAQEHMDGVDSDQDSFAIDALPTWLLGIDRDLQYGRICERLEDECERANEDAICEANDVRRGFSR